MKKILAILLLPLLSAALFLPSGCQSQPQNNHLQLNDFVDYLVRSGLPVESIQPVNPKIVDATQGIAVRFRGIKEEIGLYRYDLARPENAKRVDRFREQGYLYIEGCKFPALVCGSFVIIGYEKNPLKQQIIDAINQYED